MTLASHPMPFRAVVLFSALAVSLAVLADDARQPGQKKLKDAAPRAAGVKKKSKVKLLGRISGSPEWVTSVAVSPDGKQFAAGSYGEIRRFQANDRKKIDTIKVRDGYVRDLAFSPDGKTLAAGSYQRTILIDVSTGKVRSELKGQRGQVTGVAYSPDGRWLATSSDDETVHLWQADDTPVRVLEGHSYPVQGVTFSPDGKRVVSAAGDETRNTKPGEVITWDAASGKQLSVLTDHKKAATAAAFSPDGKLLVTTSFDETVNVYASDQEQPLGFFGGHGRPTTSALFSPDGRFVVTGSGGRAKGKNEIKLWLPADGEELATIGDHAARVTDIAISPDGRTLYSTSYDKTICAWDISALTATNAARPATVAAAATATAADEQKLKTFRAGIIGLDTSHVIAFTKILNNDKVLPELAGCRVVAAYPKGSPDIESSTKRVPGYTRQVKDLGVEIVESIPELIKKVDVVLLETNDGRPHLEQILPVLKAGKPTFIDKPIAGSLADAVAIFQAARKYKTPVFSSSSLRYGKTTLAVRNGSIGKVTKCETTSPCSLEKTHPDLFWYGIHGVESLFTVMGAGCETVVRAESTEGRDVVVGTWKGGRTGTFTGLRPGKGYGGTATGTKGTSPVGKYDGYQPLVVDIVRFFRTGKSSIPERETIEIYAFMEAADESKRQNGKPVSIEAILAKARKAAAKRLAELDK